MRDNLPRMLSNQIRRTFLDFFARNGHEVLPSSSLIPYGDNTILFTNAGMNQFKNAFLGHEKRSYVRAATAQKVMRVSGKHNDLENIGETKRHHTFFEMLGNFSFGDYFKADAMKFALDLLEGEYGFERERMWFTIYKDDDESYELWQKVGIRASRVLRFGEKDNFWSMGPTGPCGPNSEVHYFTGKLSDNDGKWVNNDDDGTEVTAELWNLVFMQFNRTEDGVLHPLPQTGVDTGMGFERLVRLLQGVESNYETDLFAPLIERVQQLTGETDAQRDTHRKPYRVIADHARAASFLIGDGVLPGNEGRNYVLRMIMRRAMRFGREIGLTDPFLYRISEAVIDKMGEAYPELRTRRSHILNTITQEEERFARTLDTGLERLEDEIKLAQVNGTNVLSGESVFKLYDTLGLPKEITKDVVVARGLAIDEAGFESARERAKDIARKASAGKFEGNFDQAKAYRDAYDAIKGDLRDGKVSYNPYDALKVSSSVVGILRGAELTSNAVSGEAIDIITRDTCLYVESGGQVSDTGEIAGNGWRARVMHMLRPTPELIVHHCQVIEGAPTVGDACEVSVDAARRADIMRNHTATHLLQAALRGTLGDHVGQQGSLVAPDRLRFDFSHNAPLTPTELNVVSEKLNALILADERVWAHQENYKDAIASGAMAFFSEKYGDVVRVVRVGDEAHLDSAELCGGTHVSRTGEIGSAVIVSESAVASGVRRIEVLTGVGANSHSAENAQALSQIARVLNVPTAQALAGVTQLQDTLSQTQKRLVESQRKLAKFQFDEVMSAVQVKDGVASLVARVEATDADLLREMTDWFRAKYASGVCVLGAVIGDKPSLVVAVSPDQNKQGKDAGKLIRDIAKVVGGGGGGKPTLAQAGGKDVSKLDEALQLAGELVAN